MEKPLPGSLSRFVSNGSVRPANALERSSRLGRKAVRDRGAALAILIGGAVVLTAVLAVVIVQWFPKRTATASAAAPSTVSASTVVNTNIMTGPAGGFLAVDDSGAPNANGARYTYTGPWEHVKNLNDGRSEGTSSRSFAPGAVASFDFTGSRVKLFGVTGPTGGRAQLKIDGKNVGLLDFHSADKEAGALLYESSALARGWHEVDIIVMPPAATAPTHRFVNIDGASYALR